MHVCLTLALLFAGCKESSSLYESGAADGAQSAYDGEETDEGGVSTDDAGISDDSYGVEESLIYVYVCGEVANPGVYALPEGSRICDAVDAAGGMTDAAADEYLKLAGLLTDGEKIDVPDRTEAEELAEAEAAEESGLVNINTADEAELMTLTGIGEAKAAAIIAYREENGAFSSTEELMEISGIKEGVFNQIKDQITV